MIQLLWNRYREIVLYLFFGVCSTIVNIVAYYVCAHPLRLGTVVSTCLAWLIAVICAYTTNKLWVFESRLTDRQEVWKEMLSFFTCRLLTGLLDLAIMYLCVDMLGLQDIVIKTASNVIVIVLNYLASKLLIFRKPKA